MNMMITRLQLLFFAVVVTIYFVFHDVLHNLGVDDVSRTQGSVAEKGTSSLPPIILNIGPGTTGTRSVYKAFCKLGIPSMHFGSFCTDPSDMETFNVSHSVMQGVEAGIRVKQFYKRTNHCLAALQNPKRAKGIAQDPFCSQDVSLWANDLKELLVNVTKEGLSSLHDTPYPQCASFVIDAATSARGKPPVVFMTKRDPTEWARSRKDHPLLLCKYDQSEFDILGCVDRAMENTRNNGNVLKIQDVFDRHAQGDSMSAEELKAQAVGFANHLEKFKSVASLNLFGGPRLSDDDLALAILSILEYEGDRIAGDYSENTSQGPLKPTKFAFYAQLLGLDI